MLTVDIIQLELQELLSFVFDVVLNAVLMLHLHRFGSFNLVLNQSKLKRLPVAQIQSFLPV